MAEAHPGYVADKHWCQPLFAVAHFGKTGLITPPNVMNFGLKPTRRFGGTARSLGASIYWTTADSIKFSKKAKAIQVTLDTDVDLCSTYMHDYPIINQTPLVKFPDYDPMEVLEFPRWR